MGISSVEQWMVVAAIGLFTIAGCYWATLGYARRQRRRRRFAHKRQFT